MEKGHILVIEDEVKIVQIIRAYLEKEGYKVSTATDGEEALAAYRELQPDLVVLDRMLPKISGDLLCTRFRQDSDVPILILSARSTEDDRVFGLQIGADDYLTKPFSPRELVARVQALLRRCQRKNDPENRVIRLDQGRFVIDPGRFELRRDGHLVSLTPTEFNLLSILASHPGQVFRRAQLVEAAMGSVTFSGYDRTIDAHIKNIRQKIEADPGKPRYIQTVFGVGYRFAEERVSS
jgi:DNA-binding response OmpR family regulator